ncbi:MAG: bifunctional aspartate transaminase/aspartate 4-decarboxylase [Deltaproteobacteria bacterium]|nr:bifunctional aspartate transaminase/aspartate 4-decarboxylase [Deltaproteobacteria bacterium]
MKKTLFILIILLSVSGVPVGSFAADPSSGSSPSRSATGYESLTTYELGDVLLEQAQTVCQKRLSRGELCEVLNAGQETPNFLNTTAREGFALLLTFVTDLAHSYHKNPYLGMRPEMDGISVKLDKYLSKQEHNKGAIFLRYALGLVMEKYNLNPDKLVLELVDAALGAVYPTPPRILPQTETIVNAYLNKALLGNQTSVVKFDLFATEGSAAAFTYLFNSMKANKLIRPGDQIALVTPIYAPYLDLPVMNEFDLAVIKLQGDAKKGWQLSDVEIDKLKDSRIKVLLLANPGNPTGVSLDMGVLVRIAELVKTVRKDLIIITDTGEADFVDNYVSLFKHLPENTIGVHSYSKYFGVPGWHLGLIMINPTNVVDRLISRLPEGDRSELARRYHWKSLDQDKIKFIDRLALDSRDVVLSYKGGLSGPQQAVMCLFSIFDLMDTDHTYKKSVQNLLKERHTQLYEGLGLPAPLQPGQTLLYTLIDVKHLAQIKYGEDFVKHLAQTSLVDFLLRLARDYSTVCLPTKGFAGPEWTIRVSLVNLNPEEYKKIGSHIKDTLQTMYNEWPGKQK